MVAAWTAEATATRVTVRNPGGSVVKTIRGDFYGPEHGVDLSAVDVALDGSGYVQGTFRWQQNGGYWKAVVVPESALAGRVARDRALAARDEREVRLGIARTGKRPSGKPLTPEMQGWVRDYQRGRRDFGP